MNSFVVRELRNGALLPLSELMERLPLIQASSWTFANIRLYHGSPFGLSIPEFERLTKENQHGFEVSDADFRAFLGSDFQIIDGEIKALVEGETLLTIHCFDASQWEISTPSAELAQELEGRRFNHKPNEGAVRGQS